MRSLRVQLLLGAACATAAVLFGSGVVLSALVSRTLRAEFDRSLTAKARALAALLEFDEEGLESELPAAPLPEFAAGGHAEYYQIWLTDGSVFARSPSLGARDLERFAAPSDRPAFRDVQLPDGRRGRMVQLVVVPRHEPRFRRAAAAARLTLAVAREIGGLEATLARLRGLTLAVGVAAVAVSAVVLAWRVHQNLRPVARLSREISEVGERDLSRRIAGDGMPRELWPVVDRLNNLLSRLEAAFVRERRFTGDVAHELRTPLAGLRAKLELALARDRAPEAYRSAIQECLGINLQMQHMVENLLHLTRADAGQLDFRREPVDLAAIAQDCWKPLEQRAAARGLHMEWRLGACAPVESDAEALRLTLRNLLDNAVAYADKPGRICVSVSSDDGAGILTVSNTSSLSEEAARCVFQRFWRADPSRQIPDEVRCGLGLSLCKALVEQLGGSIEAAVGEGMFRVTVRLPGRSRCAAAQAR